MKKEELSWKEAVSLEEYISDLFRQKKMNTEEFKTLLRIYGREKLEAIWKKMKGK